MKFSVPISPALRASRLLLAASVLASGAGAAALSDPPLATGPEAIDPTQGAMIGRQNITARAPTAATKEALLAVPGFAVVQSFPGLEGAMKSPVNRIEFAGGRQTVTMTLNSQTGYGGCASGPGPKGAYTSGAETPKEGEAIYIGDNVNDLAYAIEFSPPVSAAGFTVARTLPATGVPPSWVASFFGPDGALLERQVVAPTQARNVAVLFGRVSARGQSIAKIVFGRDQPATPFVLGNGAVFLDDLGFAPADPAALSAAGAARARKAIGISRPAPAAAMGAAEGESIDLAASGASPRTFLERIDGFCAVQNWKGFVGVARGGSEALNVLDFAQGLDFRFDFAAEGAGAEGLGGPTMEEAMASSPPEALRIGGTGSGRSLEITAGAYDSASGDFIADGAVYAAGFIVTNLAAGEVRATFYNRTGEVLATQVASGLEDPANAGNPSSRRGAEIYFGLIASSRSDESRWVHRIRIEGGGEARWGLDDFGFASAP